MSKKWFFGKDDNREIFIDKYTEILDNERIFYKLLTDI